MTNDVNAAAKKWPKAFVRMTDHLNVLVFHSATDRAPWRDRSDGAIWTTPYCDVANSASYRPCAVPPVDHSLTAESIATGYMRECATLTTSLAEARAECERLRLFIGVAECKEEIDGEPCGWTGTLAEAKRDWSGVIYCPICNSTAMYEVPGVAARYSDPTPLTPEAVMAMLPANVGSDNVYPQGVYRAPSGEPALEWRHEDGEFYLYVGDNFMSLESIATVGQFAMLIDALGIEVHS